MFPHLFGLKSYHQLHTTIASIMGQFSKMDHFISLAKLHLAKDMAKLVLQHVLPFHGIPVDVVSDRGSQFSSVF